MNNIDEIKNNLIASLENLPPLPKTIQELQTYLSMANDELSMKKVVEIIEHDPFATANLLHLANSAYYGFSKEIKSIEQVLVLLGVNNVKNIMVANYAKESFEIDLSPYGINTNDFLRLCDEQTDFIVKWLGNEDKTLCHTLIPCVMLLRLGIIVFARFLINQNMDKKFLFHIQKSNYKNITEIEKNLLGIDHINFLAYLFKQWNLDEIFIDSILSIDYLSTVDEKIRKSAYALAIIEALFSPQAVKNDKFNVKKAYFLLKQAKRSGVDFNIENFISILPPQYQINLEE